MGQGQGGGGSAHGGGTEKSGWDLSGVGLNPRAMAKSSGWGSLGAELSGVGGDLSDLSDCPRGGSCQG